MNTNHNQVVSLNSEKHVNPQKRRRKTTTEGPPEIHPEQSSSTSRDVRSAFWDAYVKNLSPVQYYLITFTTDREMTDFCRSSTDWIEGSTGCTFPSFDFEQLRRRSERPESDWCKLQRLRGAVAGSALLQSFSSESNIQTP